MPDRLTPTLRRLAAPRGRYRRPFELATVRWTIRNHCLACTAGSRSMVASCDVPGCWLRPYRLGGVDLEGWTGPGRPRPTIRTVSEAAGRDRRPGELVRPRLALRLNCLACVCGSPSEVRRCHIAECWSHPYRQLGSARFDLDDRPELFEPPLGVGDGRPLTHEDVDRLRSRMAEGMETCPEPCLCSEKGRFCGHSETRRGPDVPEHHRHPAGAENPCQGAHCGGIGA